MCDLRIYARGVHLSAIWKNRALFESTRCEALGEHLIHGPYMLYFHISHIFIFSHNQGTHDITDIDYPLCGV